MAIPMTAKNGATMYAIPVSIEFGEVLDEIATKENRTRHDVLLDLAYKGAECRRLHRVKRR